MFKKGQNAKRGNAQPEIYLLLHQGFTPKEIIAMGFKVTTVYKYAAQYHKVKERLKIALTKKAITPSSQ